MAKTVELTRLRVAPHKVGRLLTARPGMIADFTGDRAGFLNARLVQLPDNEWLDIVEWRSPEDFTQSREKGPNLPGIKAFFEAIDSLVSAEEGITQE